MTLKLDRGLIVLFSALHLVACRGEEEPGTSESASSTSGTTAADTDPTVPTTSESASSSTTGDESTGTPTTTTGVEPTTDTTADPTNASQGFITTMTDDGGDTGALPNGSECSSDADCASMNCFSLLGGMLAFCADCNEDQDCVDAGTGTACTLDAATQNAICTTGPNGSTCMSDTACMSGFCDAVIEIPIPGFLPDTCGECSETADCTMDQICSPAFDIAMFSGQKNCVEPGSVPNDQLCPEGAEGNVACMSGHCTEASIMGIIPLNVCGECADDSDCAPGETCTPAEASQNGFSGSTCG